MENKANYVAVGAFVLACVIGLVVTILWLAGAQYSQEYSYYQTFFKGPVTGLGDGTTRRQPRPASSTIAHFSTRMRSSACSFL